jgi:DNA-binding NarL/FixJ family response regulator
MVLERAGGPEVVSEAGDAEPALRTVLGHKRAILVLDLNMPGALDSRRRSGARDGARPDGRWTTWLYGAA